MQITQKPFRPLVPRSSQTAVTTSVQSVQLSSLYVGGFAVRLANVGTANVFFSFSTGVDAGLTTSNGHVLLPNTAEIFFFADDMTHVNFVGSATGSTLCLSIGEGS